jgi:hypothetical protein
MKDIPFYVKPFLDRIPLAFMGMQKEILEEAKSLLPSLYNGKNSPL